MSEGLSPEVLHKVLSDRVADFKGKAKESGPSWVEIGSSEDATGLPKVVYEINSDSDHFEPRLRLIVSSAGDDFVSFPEILAVDESINAESEHAHITELQDDDHRDEGRLTNSSHIRGRTVDSESIIGPRSHSTSPEHISTYVVYIFTGSTTLIDF